jgi:hypothetical protein
MVGPQLDSDERRADLRRRQSNNVSLEVNCSYLLSTYSSTNTINHKHRLFHTFARLRSTRARVSRQLSEPLHPLRRRSSPWVTRHYKMRTSPSSHQKNQQLIGKRKQPLACIRNTRILLDAR